MDTVRMDIDAALFYDDTIARARCTIDGINRGRKALGEDAESALTILTARSLTVPTDIIDEYRTKGLQSIFLRPLSPYGFARKTQARQGVSYGGKWIEGVGADDDGDAQCIGAGVGSIAAIWRRRLLYCSLVLRTRIRSHKCLSSR